MRKAALIGVVAVMGASLLWWAKKRPAYLLYQAHRQVGEANQAAVVAEYERLLRKKNLSKEDEIRLRRDLAEFYVKAVDSSRAGSISYVDRYDFIDPVSLNAKQKNYTVSTVAEHPFLTAADKQCKRILELDPNNAEAHWLTGWILSQRKLDNFAIESLNKSRRLAPNDPRPLVELSRIHLDREDPVLAKDTALQALALSPDFNDARLALIGAYDHLGEYGLALEEYTRLSAGFRSTPEIKARYALALAIQNRWQESAEEIEAALQAAPGNGWVKYYYGRILFERGIMDHAAAQFEQSGALLPRQGLPLVWQAYAFARRGQCDQIGRVSQLVTNPHTGLVARTPFAHLINAWWHICRGDGNRALSELDEALRLNPKYLDAQRLKAQIFMDKGQYDQLGDLIRPMLDRKINRSEAYAFLAQSFFRQGNLDLAQESAETSLQLNLRNPWPYVWLAFAHQAKGNEESAKRAMREATSLNTHDHTIAGYAAFFAALLGNDEDAESRLKARIEKDAHNPILWLLLGDIHLFRRRYSEAVPCYQSAAEIRPYLLLAQFGLVEAYQQLGEKEAAQSAQAASVRINPRFRDTRVRTIR